MPELPEVETIKRGLLKFILNKKVVRVKVSEKKSFIGEEPVVVGQKICAILRRGKALILELENSYSMMVHLRMTGQLVYRDKTVLSGVESAKLAGKLSDDKSFAGGHPTDTFFAGLPNKQTRVEIEFEEGSLFFNDQRKFGFIKVMKTEEVERDSFIAGLAKEPWEMTAAEFYKMLMRHKNALIKAAILDQKNIAGLGNIYADEALFFAKIHPATRAGKVTEKEAEQILLGARKVMTDSIESGGSTMATYVKADGTTGDYLELFAKVFSRTGQPCVRCGTKIKKIKVAGRGTHICPKCQELK